MKDCNVNQSAMSSNRAVTSAHGRLNQEDPEIKVSLYSELHREFYQLPHQFLSNPGLHKRRCPQDSMVTAELLFQFNELLFLKASQDSSLRILLVHK